MKSPRSSSSNSKSAPIPRKIKVHKGSFPKVKQAVPLKIAPKKLWQVLCGDLKHWRVGIYSPDLTSDKGIEFLEKHSCPEFFMLLKGNITLVVEERKKLKKIRLKPLAPILVTSWHSGFCPNGQYSGIALVIERDIFMTRYKKIPTT